MRRDLVLRFDLLRDAHLSGLGQRRSLHRALRLYDCAIAGAGAVGDSLFRVLLRRQHPRHRCGVVREERLAERRERRTVSARRRALEDVLRRKDLEELGGARVDCRQRALERAVEDLGEHAVRAVLLQIPQRHEAGHAHSEVFGNRVRLHRQHLRQLARRRVVVLGERRRKVRVDSLARFLRHDARGVQAKKRLHRVVQEPVRDVRASEVFHDRTMDAQERVQILLLDDAAFDVRHEFGELSLHFLARVQGRLTRRVRRRFRREEPLALLALGGTGKAARRLVQRAHDAVVRRVRPRKLDADAWLETRRLQHVGRKRDVLVARVQRLDRRHVAFRRTGPQRSHDAAAVAADQRVGTQLTQRHVGRRELAHHVVERSGVVDLGDAELVERRDDLAVFAAFDQRPPLRRDAVKVGHERLAVDLAPRRVHRLARNGAEFGDLRIGRQRQRGERLYQRSRDLVRAQERADSVESLPERDDARLEAEIGRRKSALRPRQLEHQRRPLPARQSRRKARLGRGATCGRRHLTGLRDRQRGRQKLYRGKQHVAREVDEEVGRSLLHVGLPGRSANLREGGFARNVAKPEGFPEESERSPARESLDGSAYAAFDEPLDASLDRLPEQHLLWNREDGSDGSPKAVVLFLFDGCDLVGSGGGDAERGVQHRTRKVGGIDAGDAKRLERRVLPDVERHQRDIP